MNNPLFDISPYQTRSTHSYSADWRDATGSDPAWDEPELHPDKENFPAEPSSDAQDNCTVEPTMAKNETDVPLHAEVEVVEELSPEEEADRQRLELKVERAFYQAGAALRELRSRRLYRSTHRTFEEYCQDRFGFQRRHSYQLIEAAGVFDNLCANGAQDTLSTTDQKILPTNERQVRPLITLEPNKQREVWQQAVEASGGKVPNGRVVKELVERLKEKPLTHLVLSYKCGDAFILQRLTGAERRYNGCWAIAREVLEFSLKVETHDATLQVKPENLDPIDDRTVCRELTVLLKRIGRLRKRELDRGALAVLESLGKQTYLTEVEEKLLKVLENHYSIT